MTEAKAEGTVHRAPEGSLSPLPQGKECIGGPPRRVAPAAMASLQALSLWGQQSHPRSAFFSMLSQVLISPALCRLKSLFHPPNSFTELVPEGKLFHIIKK